MIQFGKILAIGAHPDDIEFGCMGFLLKQGAGVEKHIYVASLGSAGDPSTGPARQQESAQALASLKPTSIHFRREKGIEAGDFNIVLDQLTSIIGDIQPDLILTLGDHDTHQEHRRIYEITLAAARRSRASILAYGILSNTLDFKPALFVDIGQVIEEKKQSLRHHLSQKDKYYMTDEYFEIFHSNTYASLHGLRYCEAYEIVRIFT